MDAAHVQVATLLPLQSTFTYAVPSQLSNVARVGCRVVVPFGGRRVVGVIVDDDRGRVGGGDFEIKPLSELLDIEPLFDEALLAFLQWTSGYYLAPLGEVIRAALPASLQGKQTEYLQLTDAGAEALAHNAAILRRPGEELAPRYLEVLRQVGESKAKALSRRTLRGQWSVVKALLRRGLLTQTARPEPTPRPVIDLQLRSLARSNDAADLLLRRAPRQAELLEALDRAGGNARLGTLAGVPSGARALARKLADKGLVELEEVEVPRDPFAAGPVEASALPHTLTTEQQQALDEMLAAFAAGQYRGFLLHGVTSSGKTEVYLQLIAEVLAGGRTALVLVPEIALTPQLAARFRARFGERVAVLHSGLSTAQRYEQWRAIRRGAVQIVVGARSAIFAPLDKLGAVIVDEEHDGSFKQEEGVRYNARDLALVRAKRCDAIAVLGSATPSLESRHGADRGRLTLLTLRKRATPQPLPAVEVIDLRRFSAGKERVLSAPLAAAISETLQRGEQTILFLNRRGFSPFVLCRGCGYVFACENCSVSLTHHRSVGRLICHYCGFAAAPPVRCPACGAAEEAIGMLGLGTERVEQHLKERYPEARVARLDRDTGSGRGLRELLSRVGRREVDILVGTQMVTKGHDFPHVTLVGVVCADLGLHFPDFRAAERTFQLLTQVAGRAGRGSTSGRVLIQSYSPDHPSIRHACSHDYDGFFSEELAARRELSYPPCSYMAAVRVDGPDAEAVATEAARLCGRARQLIAAGSKAVTLLGPTEAPLQRLKGRTRWLMLLRSEHRAALRGVIEGLAAERAGQQNLRVAVDVDPVSLL